MWYLIGAADNPLVTIQQGEIKMSHFVNKAKSNLNIGSVARLERKELVKVSVVNGDVTFVRPESVERLNRWDYMVHYGSKEYVNVTKSSMERLYSVINSMPDNHKSIKVYHNGFVADVDW